MKRRKAVGGRVPHDLHKLFLKRLPLRDLCRYRTVCKSWYSDISTIEIDTRYQRWFILQHAACETRPRHSISVSDFGGLCNKIKLSGFEKKGELTMVSTSGGLGLFLSVGGLPYVYNPLTHRRIGIPLPVFWVGMDRFQRADRFQRVEVFRIQSRTDNQGNASFLVACLSYTFGCSCAADRLCHHRIQCYSSGESKWSSLDLGDGGHCDGTAALDDSKLYFLTKDHAASAEHSLLRVCLVTGTRTVVTRWTCDLRFSEPGYHSHGLAISDGEIVLASLDSVSQQDSREIRLFRLEENEWEPLSKCRVENVNPRGYARMSLHAHNGLIAASVHDSWYVYDIAADNWSTPYAHYGPILSLMPYSPSFAKLSDTEGYSIV